MALLHRRTFCAILNGYTFLSFPYSLCGGAAGERPAQSRGLGRSGGSAVGKSRVRISVGFGGGG